MKLVDEKKESCSITFEEMLQGLHEIFEEDHVIAEDVIRWLEKYHSDYVDWKQYAIFDMHKYTRNLVDKGNGKFNVMILCWGEGMGSSIHDHSNAHCFVKMLDGTLKETQYEWPEDENDDKPMTVKGDRLYHTDGVTYINDAMGLHRMENPCHSETCVSLHIYVPAFDKCCTFDERTGHKRVCPVTFWSEFGKRQSLLFKP